MSSILDLDELENKAFKSFNQDGLWDIYLGLVLSWLYLSDRLFRCVKESWIRILGLCAGFALIYTLLMYYSILFGASFIGAILLYAPESILLAGLPMLIIGIIVFIRFIRQYSILEIPENE